MSCCGSKRNAFQSHSISDTYRNDSAVIEEYAKEDLYFEYTGNSALTVTGSITGRKYRFAFPGDVQAIVYSDAGAMMALPMIRKVKHATKGG